MSRAGRRAIAPAEGVRNLTRIRGWAWWFVAAGWPVEEVAWLFDVEVEALELGDVP